MKVLIKEQDLREDRMPLNYTANNVALTIHPKVSWYVIQYGSSLRSRSSLKTSQFKQLQY